MRWCWKKDADDDDAFPRCQQLTMWLLTLIAAGIISSVVRVLLVIILQSKKHHNNKNKKEKKSSSSSTPLALRSCPNPNCIRCQRYKMVQQSANKRLHQLISTRKRQWEQTDNNHNHNHNPKKAVSVEDIFKRIIKGVQRGPPPLPSSTSITVPELELELELELVARHDISWWRRLFAKQKKHESTLWQNATNQYPTVCFIPHLSVHANATHLHPEACQVILSFLRRVSIMHPDPVNHNHHARGQSKNKPNLNHISSKDMLMAEYLESQFNGGQWQTNDSTALLVRVEPELPNENINQPSQELWEVLYLMNQGQWIQENINRCPQAFALVKAIPGLMQNCMFGNVFFSVLYPGTKIEEHCGPTNVRHRMHVPLLVPKTHDGADADADAGVPILKVNDEILTWKEGTPFVFDDSLAHAAEYPANDESEVRVVMVIDLWHADLCKDERDLISELYPSVKG